MEAARAWRSTLALGVLLSLGWTLLFQSMKLIAIANAVLLNYMAPVFVALLAPAFLKERIERGTVFALATSMAGMMIISSQQDLQAGSLSLSGTHLRVARQPSLCRLHYPIQENRSRIFQSCCSPLRLLSNRRLRLPLLKPATDDTNAHRRHPHPLRRIHR